MTTSTTTGVSTAPVPLDVLAAAEQCIRGAMAASPGLTPLPAVSEAAVRQVIDGWRSVHAPPPGAQSLLDKAAALLTHIVQQVYEPFRVALESGVLNTPVVDRAGLRLNVVAAAPPPGAGHVLFLLEEYQVTTFLGRYGVGRTLNTLSLLPGEETKIRIKTWRTTSTTDVSTASVLDSEEQEVSDSFATTVARETTSTTTAQQSRTWDVSAEGSASFGFGEVKASTSFQSQAQTSRESFARAASNQVRAHARSARSQRKTELTHSTTTTTATGQEEAVDRVVRNVNLRRTLNFVFSELNQEYVTRLHLTGVRFAHGIVGQAGAWEEYSLSDVPRLLDRWIQPEMQPQVATSLLASCATINDRNLVPVHPLEVLCPHEDGTMSVVPVDPSRKPVELLPLLPLPGSMNMLRWRPGPLAPASGADGAQTAADPHAVVGVLLSELRTIMPTGAIVVDAVLGNHDALDDYAMRTQEAQLSASEAANTRQVLLNDALMKLEPRERVRAYTEATFGIEESPSGKPVPED